MQTTGDNNGIVAVFADAFSPFHREVLDELFPHFRAAGFGMLAVTGRDVQTDRTANIVQNNVDQSRDQLNVRGTVVICGATPPQLADDEVREYISRLATGPAVSFGIKLPGVASAFINWDGAIADLMAHMVQNDARRRFAFIRGFAGDPHSQMREAGFRTGLRKAGLQVDENLMVNGNYSIADARLAVAQLVNEGRQLDAVIAANDDMAIGAIAALNESGLVVPDDVIVAGFDDSAAALRSVPALTSVLLDTPRLAAATANLLIDAIGSGDPLDPDREIHVPSALVVRDSTTEARRVEQTSSATSAHQETHDQSEALRAALSLRLGVCRALHGQDLTELIDAAVKTLVFGDTSFADTVFAKAEAASHAQPTAPDAHPARPQWLQYASEQIHELLTSPQGTLVSERGFRVMVQQLAELGRRLAPLEQMMVVERDAHIHLQERLLMRMAFCTSADELWRVLRAGLLSLGMRNAWVASDESSASADAEVPDMRIVFTLSGELDRNQTRFNRSEVLPNELRANLETDMYVLVPLRVYSSDIGYLIAEPKGEFLIELEAIASGIAQVLRNLQQVDRLQTQAARLQDANKALSKLSTRDSLTGLANRSAFMERLESELAEAHDDTQISILFLDLDGFKQINDTAGHGAGDVLLQVLANRFGRLVREGDMLARLGGDEFTFLLRHPIDSNRVSDLCHLALEAASQPTVFEDIELQVSASIGVATSPNHGRSGLELLRNADAAMYAAKAAGKNSIVYFAASESDRRGSWAVERSTSLEL